MQTLVAVLFVLVANNIVTTTCSPQDEIDGYTTLFATGGEYIGPEQMARLISRLKQFRLKLEGENTNVSMEVELEELAVINEEKCMKENTFERYHFMLNKFKSAKTNLVPYLTSLLEQQRDICRESLAMDLIMAMNSFRMASRDHIAVKTLLDMIANNGIYLKTLTRDIPNRYFVDGAVKYLTSKPTDVRRYSSIEMSEHFLANRFRRLIKSCWSIVEEFGPVVGVYEELGGHLDPQLSPMRSYVETLRPNVIVCKNLLNKPLLQEEIAQAVIRITAPAIDIPRNYKFDLNTIK